MKNFNPIPTFVHFRWYHKLLMFSGAVGAIAGIYFCVVGAASHFKNSQTNSVNTLSKNTGPGVGLVDLNLSSQEELMRLPGIGTILSKRLIEKRPYKLPADVLKRVPTLGIKRWQSIEPLIVSLSGTAKKAGEDIKVKEKGKVTASQEQIGSSDDTIQKRVVTIRNLSSESVRIQMKSIYPFDLTPVNYSIRISARDKWVNFSHPMYTSEAYSIELLNENAEVLCADVFGASAKPLILEINVNSEGQTLTQVDKEKEEKKVVIPSVPPLPRVEPLQVQKVVIPHALGSSVIQTSPSPLINPLPLFERPKSNTVFFNEINSGNGELTVTNGTSLDSWVKLVHPTRHKVLLSIYIRAHSKIKLSTIKPGTYQACFALGEGWDTSRAVMPKIVSASTFEKLLTFLRSKSKYTVISLTLNPVIGGNALAREIPIEEFQKY